MTREQQIISELLANINEDLPREQWTKHMTSAVEEAERYLEEQQSGIEYSCIKTVPLSGALSKVQSIEELVLDALAERIEWVEDITYILIDVFALRQIVAEIMGRPDLSDSDKKDLAILLTDLERHDAIPDLFIDISA